MVSENIIKLDFFRVWSDCEMCPWPEPSGWEAVEAAKAVEAARLKVREAQDRQHGANRRLAARIVQAADGWPMPDFSVEVDLEGPYEPVVWLHGEFGKIRAAWDMPLRELARVATFLPDVPYWAFAAEEGPTKPAFSWDLAVPYSRARGEEATHVLLFDAGTGRCVGHLPPLLPCDEALAAAQKVWDEVEDSWRRVMPAFQGSPWSAESAESPVTPDTLESAGSAE
jgi:hypothetical protein|nr:MAG TPA: hypothetical protein [Caudoviricetes sp.]